MIETEVLSLTVLSICHNNVLFLEYTICMFLKFYMTSHFGPLLASKGGGVARWNQNVFIYIVPYSKGKKGGSDYCIMKLI